MFFLLKWPPVAILDIQKSLLTISDQYHNFYFCDLFYKMAAGGHFGCPKLIFDGISGHFRSIGNCFFFKFLQNGRRRPFWMSEIHVRSHLWAFQIDMQLKFVWIFLTNRLPSTFWMSEIHFRSHFWPFRSIHNLQFLEMFDKMAAVGHFRCPKFTFDRISDHFRSIRIFFFEAALK